MTASKDSVSNSIIERAEKALCAGLEEAEDRLEQAVARLCEAHPDHAAAIRQQVEAARAGGLNAPGGDGSSWDAPAAPAAEGDIDPIGPYRPIAELGRGGQGMVYLAEDSRLGRVVALKVLKGFGPLSEKMMQRFRREAEVASKLDHPGVCAVYDAGVRDGVPYIAMRYVEGHTLAEKIREARRIDTVDSPTTVGSVLDFRDEEQASETAGVTTSPGSTRRDVLRVVEIVEKTARALHAAHEAGIIHRDIKPGNIMVMPSGDPVLLDFGLASEEANELALTQTGDLFGTPAYMSPEQLMAQRIRLDRRTDVYSLAVTLYECICLRRPFEAPTREGMYQAIQYKTAPDVRRLNPHVPADLRVVLEKALEKDRDGRYATAVDFAQDLQRVRELKPVVAKPVSPLGRMIRWAKRRPVRAALVAVLVVGIPLLSTLVGYVLAKQPELRAAAEKRFLDRIEDRLEEGFMELAEGQPGKALAAFDAALELESDSVGGAAGKAIALCRAKSFDQCLAWLDDHAEVEKANAALSRVRVAALRGLGRTSEARDREERVPEPTKPLAFFLEAVWLTGTGKVEAGKVLAHATRAAMSTTHARLLFHYTMASAARHLDDPQASRRASESLIRLWPDSHRAWYGAGLARKDRDNKIAAFSRALELRPGATRARAALDRLEGDQ